MTAFPTAPHRDMYSSVVRPNARPKYLKSAQCIARVFVPVASMRVSMWLVLFMLVFIKSLAVADVNILVIGSDRDSSEYNYSSSRASYGFYTLKAAPTKAFDPAGVVSELTNILKGDSEQGAVRVVFEDFNGKAEVSHNEKKEVFRHTNLFSWFHFPYPLNVASEVRWPNLRGELDVKWDYVVLIGDAHTIERMPGFYALGVSEICKEVAKGGAQTVLLMPWPSTESSSSYDHYKEVVYRVGRTGGCAVAPAGLAWQNIQAKLADRSEKDGEADASHPPFGGSYLAAATLYSRLFGKSATTSSYRGISKTLADAAYKTVKANQGAVQYSGRFATPHPHAAQFNHNRNVRYSITGTSTERGHIKGITEVMKQCRVKSNNDLSHRYDTNDPGAEGAGWPVDEDGRFVGPIDFNFGKYDFYNYDEYKVNPDFWKRAYIFPYQWKLTPESAVAQIAYHDLGAGVKAYSEGPYVGATIPRASWAMLKRLRPDIKMAGSGNHLSGIAIVPNTSFIYTVDSGRCPLPPEEVNPSDQWSAMRVGYEAGWIMSNLQARAPGMRVLPSSEDKQEINHFHADGAEEMSVQFIFEPQQEVTVHLTSSMPSLIKIEPSMLTFTPENHDVAQTFRVSVVSDGSFEGEVTVNVATTSADEVYDELVDSWAYTAKTRASSSVPVAMKDGYRVAVGGALKLSSHQGVVANDKTSPKAPITKVSLVEDVRHGALELDEDGSLVYTPERGFHGADSFSYRVHNKNGESEAVAVNLAVSDLDPSLILWYDFGEIEGSRVKDMSAYGRDGIPHGVINQVAGVAGVTGGPFAADLHKGTIDIPIDDEFHELVDREISIAFWSYISPIASTSKNSSSYVLKGTKTYGDKTYSSLRLRLQTQMATDRFTAWWENGIYRQGNRTSEVGKTSSYKLRAMTEDTKVTASDISGQWVHWTFTRTRNGGGEFRIFKDGKQIAKHGLAGLNAIAVIDEFDDLVLGDGYMGALGDFRIYNRELSKAEIDQIIRAKGVKAGSK